MTRALLVFLVCGLFFLALPGCGTGPAATDGLSGSSSLQPDAAAAPTGRAVSLGRLADLLKGCRPGGDCPREVLELGGATTLAGFVIDPENHDVILVGRVDPGRPALHTEDLLTALRAVNMKYASLKDGVYQYFNPSCSIDPDPRDFAELQSQASGRWPEICRRPQVVSVRGLPFDCRFARVMVEADYDMKALANGASLLKNMEFRSLPQIRLAEDEQDMLAGRPVKEGFTINRFWFFPGETSFIRQAGQGVLIEKAVVTLLTEKEYIDRRGKYSGAGTDPQAEEFARRFARDYALIAQERPIYLELENLFRLTALAKALDHEKAFKTAGLDAGFLLDGYQLPRAEVRRTVPGFYAEDRLTVKTKSSTIQSCGGVSISLDLQDRDFSPDSSGKTSRALETVRQARPSPQALTWTFPEPEND
ncbi:MAG: DUF1598 domain-containing protein [Pseudomonadota bacterium]